MDGVSMATLRDVARAAGVSVTTASAALRGADGVKASTRKRIVEAAREVRYSVNTSARFLRQGRNNVIAFVVPVFDNPYFSDLARAIAEEGRRRGRQVIVQQTNTSLVYERGLLELVNSLMCDGLILHLYNVPAEELRTLIGDRPAVLFEDYSVNPLYDNVALPLEPAFKAAFTYLRQRGYARAAVVGGQRFVAGQPNVAGHNIGIDLATKALIGAGLGSEADAIACEWTVEGGLRAAAEIVQNNLQYDALFCMNDLIAFGLIRGLRSMGVDVPRDKAVFGFDGVSPASYTTPALSTIAVDFEGMARSAVSMLIDRIDGDVDGPARREITGFRLVRGESA